MQIGVKGNVIGVGEGGRHRERKTRIWGVGHGGG